MIGMFVGNKDGGEIFWIDVKGRKGSDSCAAADAEVDEDLCFSRVQIDTISAASAVKRAKQCHGKLLSYGEGKVYLQRILSQDGGIGKGSGQCCSLSRNVYALCLKPKFQQAVYFVELRAPHRAYFLCRRKVKLRLTTKDSQGTCWFLDLQQKGALPPLDTPGEARNLRDK